jgi:bile acid-coenzyme A ligase
VTSDSAAGPVSYGRRLTELALARPDEVALVLASVDGREESWTRAELDRFSNQVARGLARRGVTIGSTVVLALPNSVEHPVAALATWKLGALVLPLSPRTGPAERAALLQLAAPTVVIADWTDLGNRQVLGRAELAAVRLTEATGGLPDWISVPGKAIASGGSTGRPKIIVDPAPWARRPGELVRAFSILKFRSRQRQLVAGPLYHNAPFLWLHYGLFEEGQVVLMERFDAARAVDLIERHRIEWTMLVPTMMSRMARLPDIASRDLSSLEAVYHTGGPCPPWVKRAWIDLVGAERVKEAYGSTENIGAAVISGEEWLAHPGSVGRPLGCELRILDSELSPLPPGEVGEIFSRPEAAEPFHYRGADPIRTTPDGFASVGDLGWLDRDGYLYLADRRTDLVVTGGVNVYPAEVEAVLTEHPSVADAAVIGLPDPDLGKQVHARVVPMHGSSALSIDQLLAHCRQRLSPPKVPRTIEVVAELPRNEAGKIRRDALVAARLGAR